MQSAQEIDLLSCVVQSVHIQWDHWIESVFLALISNHFVSTDVK